MTAARVTAEQMRFRDDTLTAENEKLKVFTLMWFMSAGCLYCDCHLIGAQHYLNRNSIVDADTIHSTSKKDLRFGARNEEAFRTAKPSATNPSSCQDQGMAGHHRVFFHCCYDCILNTDGKYLTVPMTTGRKQFTQARGGGPQYQVEAPRNDVC